MKNNIILSICIPTFNRAEYLDKTLHSIVSQKRFIETDDVEIVISDNCSEDNTMEISEKYRSVYHEKIRYFRNSENIKDTNFEKVLGYGNGLFLKLNNDTLMHQVDTLDKIINTINLNIVNKDVLFFSNGTLKTKAKIYCKNLDDFVKIVSFYSTWIVCFGIWKEDFDAIDNFSENANLQLVQTDILFQMISSGKAVYVDNDEMVISIPPARKGGYNIYRVFAYNYIEILKTYKQKKQISRITFFNEESKLLRYFLIPWTLLIWLDKENYYFEKKNAFWIVFKNYYSHPLFYFGLIYTVLRIFKKKIAIFLKNKTNIKSVPAKLIG